MFQRCSDQSRHPGCPHSGDTGGGVGGGTVCRARLPSGSGHMVTPWIKGCHLSRLIGSPSPVSRPPLPGLPGEMDRGREVTSGWAGAEGTEAQVPAGQP